MCERECRFVERGPHVHRAVAVEHCVVVHHVGHRHHVLRKRARLVGADTAGRPERLHALQVLHQHALRGHAVCCERQRHGDRDKESLGYVGDDDSDHEHEVGDEVRADEAPHQEEHHA